MSRNTTISVIVGVLLVCCFCVLCIGSYFAVTSATSGSEGVFSQISTQLALTSRAPNNNSTSIPFFSDTDTPSPAPVINLTPIPTPVAGAADTLETLDKAVMPVNDLRLIAMRLKGVKDIPTQVGTTNNDWPIGKELDFTASNQDTSANFKVKAKLIYKTDNVYFFAQDGTSADPGDVKKLVDDFQQHAYKIDREFFGSEPNPGIDGDPHLYILFARGLGSTVAGYFSSKDEYSKLAQPDSNEKEMFFINADAQGANDPYLVGVLAHEFQHMIHNAHDINEDTWMNEGFSVLAEFLNKTGGYFDDSFTGNPDLQLNAWEAGGAGGNAAHYGAAFLFLNYFLDRFGEDATKALVADQDNGMQAVDDVLTKQNLTDNGKPITSTDLFADWVIANYLNDASVGDGRYVYKNYPEMPKISSPTDTVSSCPAQQQGNVHQFAARYIEIDCTGKYTLRFTGSQQIRVAPADPHSGRYFFWSNRGDKSDSNLTREFDLTSVKSATLKYWTWYNIEKDYDYGYVEVSTDGGATYTILKSPSCTTDNPSGNSFGCGYTDNSGGNDPAQWIEESVDLSAYAGQKVLVRFEYITDDAVNLNGMLIDDISVPEINYTSDFETDDGGWKGEGFVRIDNALPQEYVVQVIQGGAATKVERLTLDAANTGVLPLDLSGGHATVVVSGVTPFTTELASYQIEIK